MRVCINLKFCYNNDFAIIAIQFINFSVFGKFDDLMKPFLN